VSTQSLKESIFSLVQPVLQSEEAELVDVEFEGEPNGKTLRILVHKKGGVSVEDCRHITKIIQPILSVHQLLADNWAFEVSSPGIDRPLVSHDDFRRNQGQLISVQYLDQGKLKQSVGRIESITDTSILIKVQGTKPKRQKKSPRKSQAQLIEVEIADIQSAQIELVW
tara:strand:- start:39 stop:542 length:504 start_codon:yes stop_codon:yes gene_type:complete